MLGAVGVLAAGGRFSRAWSGKRQLLRQDELRRAVLRGCPTRSRRPMAEGDCAWRRGTAMARPRRITVFDGRPARGRIHHAPGQQRAENDAHLRCPNWVTRSRPFAAMLIRAGAWRGGSYIPEPSIPGRLRAEQRPLYLFLLNSVFRRDLQFRHRKARASLGRTAVEGGDGAIIDGGINGLALGFIHLLHPPRGPGAVRATYSPIAFAMVDRDRDPSSPGGDVRAGG